MKVLYKRFISMAILLGAVLVILQFVFGFMSTFMSLDSIVTSTATSLLGSTNNEVKENLDQYFKRMIRVGNQVSSDENFISYTRIGADLSDKKNIEKELSLGKILSSYTSLDNFCDCCIVFSDGTYLGQLDAYTTEQFPDKELYQVFSDVSERDSQNFLSGNHQDYSRIYYSKVVNPSTIVLISVLREDIAPVFYDAEENFNLTLHFSTPENYVVYSGDENEMVDGKLSDELSQTIENSSHLSVKLRDHIIASDTCINGWRVTSTIPESTLAVDNKNLRTVYIIISVVITIVSIILIVIMSLSAKKRITELDTIEENLDDYSDIDKVNLN